MGVEFIIGGMTIEKVKTIEDVRAVVESFREQIVAKIDDIDPSGYFDDEDSAADELIESIIEGVTTVNESRGGGQFFAPWDVPGNEDVYFLVFGGSSWGDSPFDEFDAVCFAGEAASTIPDFGRAVGILGGGIRFDYEA
ncbi:hypothetical protein QEH42_gp149 [Microbacterium phage Pumpernickel]|uniref:Uncharacterized protein n=1 Tax=Microbacterium phage Pumpernickel TaxID=2885983 RepID=A0AAE9C3M8_9CAUD|nr:hypothetical protein QEH42_gp018 [Microbacterium phage Pumpernickel]YP_010755309.1 hypothetical protein QEH42_gp149 [Microbacterium phage Pumpernickel]UDL15809.1 hypothetical protein SEA_PUMPERNICKEL_18 [Microbacterium phage Pumpernickel]UDL16069.1 hypothetical protein SEA_PUMPERNICKEL_319 [Microbacterium phage Pumpernickel]